jgi:TFIIF-interacting CTD phosphatase-like protein
LDNFEVFIFSASLRQYVIATVHKLIPDFREDHILSREHCRIFKEQFVKDLTIFDCPVSDVVIVDNNPACFCLQPENGILVGSWTGCRADSVLILTVLPILMDCCDCQDVRSVIKTKQLFGSKPFPW